MKRTVFYLLFTVCYLALCGQSSIQHLYLVRHAAVDMDKPAFVGARRAADLYQKYNLCPITAFDGALVRQQIEAENPAVYSSTMLRAAETAAIVFPGDSIRAKPLFNEYEMGITGIPLLQMPYAGWTGLSRLFWQLHLNNQEESRWHARKRMKKAAARLELYAQRRGSVVLFAHGLLIRDLRHQLQKQGWVLEKNGGNKNLAVSHLTKISNP